jgi:hypothetical protein
MSANYGMVPRRGLEPPRLAAPPPEGGASTNSAIWAHVMLLAVSLAVVNGLMGL